MPSLIREGRRPRIVILPFRPMCPYSNQPPSTGCGSSIWLCFLVLAHPDGPGEEGAHVIVPLAVTLEPQSRPPSTHHLPPIIPFIHRQSGSERGLTIGLRPWRVFRRCMLIIDACIFINVSFVIGTQARHGPTCATLESERKALCAPSAITCDIYFHT